MRSSWTVPSLLAVLTVGTLATRPAHAQLVAAHDGSGTSSIWLIDLTNVNPNRALVTASTGEADAWGMASDEETGTLYWNNGGTLYKAAYDPVNPLVPGVVGSMTIGGSAMNVTGMAYDTVEDKLYGYRNITVPGFYEISTVDATCTLVFATPASTDFGGFDYDPVTDKFYGLNDGTGLAGRGLYRIDKPLSAPTFTLITAYPGTDTDIDGLAIGGGYAYYINDILTQNIFVFNLTTLAYEADIPSPFTTTGGTFSAGAFAPGLLIPPIGTNLRIVKTDSPDPVVPPGGTITYTLTATNLGPDPATGVVVSDTLPGNVTFVSVDPPGMHSGGVITANIGNMAANDSVAFNVVVQSPAFPDTVVNTATISGNEVDPFLPNNTSTATTTVRDPMADVSVSIVDPADCTVGVGGTLTYTITVANAGPETGNGIVLDVTLPNDATFLSSNPPGVPVGNLLSLNLGSIAAAGNTVVTVDVSPTSPVVLSISAIASVTEQDPNLANNFDSENFTVIGGGPTSAKIRGVLSTVPTSPTSDVPGLAPAKFHSTGGLDRPFRSPDNSRWAMFADTDLATTIDQVILVGSGLSFSVGVQEGVTTLDLGDRVGIIDTVIGINDSGQYCFSTNTDHATLTIDEVVVKWDGAQFVTVAREGSQCPAFGAGVNYGTASSSATIRNDGKVAFTTNITGQTTTTDTVLLADDGQTLVAQEGVTIPGNQDGGTTFTYKAFDSGATDGQGYFAHALSPTGFIMSGTINHSNLAMDRVTVVNGNVVTQEGVILPGSGFPSPPSTTAPLLVNLEPDGTWFAYGSNADAQDWVVRNGVVIAKTDDPIVPSAAETWSDDTGYAQTFFFALGNNNGDYVVGGKTNSTNAFSDAVLVQNGIWVIARENDPIDLDNNGVFDDQVYLSVFRDDFAFMTNTEMWLVVRMRNEAEALCDAGTDDIGQALIRVRLVTPGDMNCDGKIDGLDAGAFALAVADPATYEANYPDCNVLNGDTNLSGATSFADLTSFVNLILAQ